MKTFQLVIISFMLLLASCSKTEIKKSTDRGIYGWLVPLEELVIRENNHDVIPSIDDPLFINLHDTTLNPKEEVLVYQTDNQVRIYPVNILWSHEIVNDKTENNFFAVSYCPLTGSGVAWNRFINGHETTFGVSGNLYNSNLVPYDRLTESYWSQMRAIGIKGPYGGQELEPEYLLHTIYSTASLAYPDALLLKGPQGDHQCDSVCLPPLQGAKKSSLVSSDFFGVVVRDQAILFDRELFDDNIRIIQTSFIGKSLVVAGSNKLGFITAYINGDNADLQAVDDNLPVIMTDSDGNLYDLMGNITDGPKKGQRLKAPFSYMAKPFAWPLFFEKLTYYKE